MKKVISLLLVLSLVATLFAACGGSSSAAPSNAGSSGAAAAPTVPDIKTEVPTDANATAGGYVELVAGTGMNWDTLTPFRGNIANDAYCANIIYETLGDLTADGEYVPWVAKNWSTDDNGFTYHFEIYDYITDSAGNHITADDYVWFFEESIAANLKPVFSKVESVEKTGDYTFDLKLKSNQVGVLEELLVYSFCVSKAAYEASADQFATSCVTTSPYKMTDFIGSVSMTFEKREDYWQTDESLIPPARVAKVDKLTLKQIAEASQMGIALESGDIDIALGLGPNTAIQFQGDNTFAMEQYSKANGHQIFFSGAPGRPVAEDKYLRQAICYAIDASGVLAACYNGFGTVMKDTCSTSAYGYQESWNDEPYYEYDLDKVKECLNQSSYKGETIHILASSGFKAQCEMVLNYLLAAGINAELELGDVAYITSIRLDGTKYDIFFNQVGCVTLPSQWSIRFDPHGYATGDGTSRHDMTLDALLDKTWTADGFTAENINEVHNYLKEEAIAYGLVAPSVINVWRADANMLNYVPQSYGCISVTACTFQGK